MFPYYWNSSVYSPQYEATNLITGRKKEIPEEMRALPEEVREALEEHQGEFRSAADREKFLSELELRK